MRTLISFVGSMIAAAAGLYAANQFFGFRPELTFTAIALCGAVVGFLNVIVLELVNAFRSKPILAVPAACLGTGAFFGGLQLLTFYSNQAPTVASPGTFIITTALVMAFVGACAGAGHMLGGMLSKSDSE